MNTRTTERTGIPTPVSIFRFFCGGRASRPFSISNLRSGLVSKVQEGIEPRAYLRYTFARAKPQLGGGYPLPGMEVKWGVY
jgi:hypothetical protein